MCALQFDFIASTDLPNITSLELFETYGCLSLTYVLGGTTYELEFPEESFLSEDFASFETPITTWIKNNLSKMTSLERFEYVSRFSSEMDFSFLVNKPKALTQLGISHLQGLDMDFLHGVEHLALNAVFIEEDDGFLDLLKKLPATLKTVKVNDIDDSMKELTSKTSFQLGII